MSFGMAYATKKRGKKMARGGEVDRPEDVDDADIDMKDSDLFKKTSGALTRSGLKGYNPAIGRDPNNETDNFVYGQDKVIGNKKAFEASDIAKRIGKSGIPMYAEGGDVEKDADMIARIMHKRKEYSEGGMVANDVGISEADKLSAEYDDLVLRDDLEGEQPSDSNEHGDSDVHDDAVDRIMMKRKKDRMPRPA